MENDHATIATHKNKGKEAHKEAHHGLLSAADESKKKHKCKYHGGRMVAHTEDQCRLNPNVKKKETKTEKHVRFTDDTKDEDAKQETVRDRLKATSTCHRCGKKGHWKKDCPHREQKANLAEVDTDEGDFVSFAVVEDFTIEAPFEDNFPNGTSATDLSSGLGQNYGPEDDHTIQTVARSNKVPVQHKAPVSAPVSAPVAPVAIVAKHPTANQRTVNRLDELPQDLQDIIFEHVHKKSWVDFYKNPTIRKERRWRIKNGYPDPFDPWFMAKNGWHTIATEFENIPAAHLYQILSVNDEDDEEEEDEEDAFQDVVQDESADGEPYKRLMSMTGASKEECKEYLFLFQDNLSAAAEYLREKRIVEDKIADPLEAEALGIDQGVEEDTNVRPCEAAVDSGATTTLLGKDQRDLFQTFEACDIQVHTAGEGGYLKATGTGKTSMRIVDPITRAYVVVHIDALYCPCLRKSLLSTTSY